MGRAKGGVLIYDPTTTVSYGSYRCSKCSAHFYGGGPALHNQDCDVRAQGYEICDYWFGPKEFLISVDDMRSPIPWRQEQGRELIDRIKSELPAVFAAIDSERLAAVKLWNDVMIRHSEATQASAAINTIIKSSGPTVLALELQRRLDRRLFEVDNSP